MAQDRPVIYLIDGSGYIFRAFFALPQLNNSRGLPTNAVYGFVRMMLKLLKDVRPSHIAVVFDSPRKTFRDDLFEAYKANRKESPSDLNVQIPYIHRAVQAMRLPLLMLEGFEADDVIGTLAVRAARSGFDSVIVTADKDFMQLVGPHVTLWDTMRDRRMGAREVRERLGVDPAAVVDVMALMGDSIDNVKGVPGIGEKTATALIAHFGSLDKLFARLGTIEETGLRGAKKITALLTAHQADAELARKLVRIDTDAPVDADPHQLEWPGIDHAAVTSLLRELEFHSMVEELAPAADPMPQPASPPPSALDADHAAAIIPDLAHAERLAIHYSPEGDGLLKLAADDLNIAVEGGAIAALGVVLSAESPRKTCHDLKAHLREFARRGISLGGADFDTMLAGFLVNPGRPEPSIADLYHDYIAPLGGSRAPGSEPQQVAAIRIALIPKLEEFELEPLMREIEMPVAKILARMEQAGIAVDAAALGATSAEFAEKLTELERECYAAAGHEFNLNSPLQLRRVLFDELKLPTKGLKKTKSGVSTDADVLEKLAATHPLPAKLLEYRALAKLKSTYSDSLPALIDPNTGRIHTSFHQALTATGRLSSTDPNLQNIPSRTEDGRRIRRAFAAPEGSLMLSADYSQIELRILAHLANDPTLIDAFASGEDIHARTAAEVLGVSRDRVTADHRRLAKVINFGIIYGMGPQRLARELAISLAEATDYIKRYFERLPGVRAYLEDSVVQARERGFVTTMYGRRRYLPELNSPQGGARAQAERIAINTPIQGTAADLIKLAMVRLDAALTRARLDARILLQVHDELLLELAREALEPVSTAARYEMERVADLRVPLRVELKWGLNWAQLGG